MNGIGIWSYVLPNNSRPVFFLFFPPHCLKKNFTSTFSHYSLRSITQSCSIGRALTPDSPPTITQSIPCKLRFGSGPKSGSKERNLVLAPVVRSKSIRFVKLTLSTETPIQVLSVHIRYLLYSARIPARFVRIWNVCFGHSFITLKTD